MEQKIDISMFRSPEGLLEAEHMLFAASVMLRQAMGEVTACNSLTGKEVFKGKRAERILPAFDTIFKIMGDAQKAFKATREELINSFSMSDVSLLRFLNSSDACIQSDILALIRELDLEESRPPYIRALGSERPRRQSLGSFEADRALQARHYRPIFRPHYKPDLSAFEPFYKQLELFPL